MKQNKDEKVQTLGEFSVGDTVQVIDEAWLPFRGKTFKIGMIIPPHLYPYEQDIALGISFDCCKLIKKEETYL